MANIGQKHMEGTTRAGVEARLVDKEVAFNSESSRLELVYKLNGASTYYHFPSREALALTTAGNGGARGIGLEEIAGMTATDVQAGIAEVFAGLSASVSPSVILAPASSTRNQIQPAGDFIPLVIRAHAAQTESLFKIESSAGASYAAVASNGDLELSRLAGSGTRMVVASASGLLSTQAIPSAGLTGSGSSNYVAYWTGAGTLSGENTFVYNPTTNILALSTISMSGPLTCSNAIGFNGVMGSGGGAMFRMEAEGLTLQGYNGTTYGFQLLTTAGSPIIRNPVGTTQINFLGAVTAASTLAVTGNITGAIIASNTSQIVAAYGVGVLGDSNMERLSFSHGASYASIYSEATGTGTVRPLRLGFSSTNYPIVINTSGFVGIGMPASVSHDLTVSKSTPGGTVGFKVMNESTTADSHAVIRVETQDNTSGDAIYQWFLDGVVYQLGADASDTYSWKLEAGNGVFGSGVNSDTLFEVDGYNTATATFYIPLLCEDGVRFTAGGTLLTHYETTNWTATLTGMTGSVTLTVRATRIGNVVTLLFDGATGTSNTTDMTITGMPAQFRPATAQRGATGSFVNSGTPLMGLMEIATGGTITCYPLADSGGIVASAWTASGTKGMEAFSITYSIA